VEDSAQVKNYFKNCICCTRDMTNIPLSVASWSFDFSSWCEPHSIFHIFYDAARSTGMASTIECVVTKSHGLAVLLLCKPARILPRSLIPTFTDLDSISSATEQKTETNTSTISHVCCYIKCSGKGLGIISEIGEFRGRCV